MPFSRVTSEYCPSRTALLTKLQSKPYMPDGLLLSATSDERKRLLVESEVFCMSVEHEFYLPVEFETLQEYLQLLEAAARALSSLKERVCFYLAAAVSDFYIPEDQVSDILYSVFFVMAFTIFERLSLRRWCSTRFNPVRALPWSSNKCPKCLANS